MPHRSWALVTVTPATGTLQRYECGGERPRLTHSATTDQKETFSARVVRNFRARPQERFAVGFDGPNTMVFA